MDLQEFALTYAGAEARGVLHRFHPFIGDPDETHESASVLIATMFWRGWLAWNAANDFRGTNSLLPTIERSRTIIVPQPNFARFDLLVLDPALKPGTAPRSMSAAVPGGDMRDPFWHAAVLTFVDAHSALPSDAMDWAAAAVADPKQPWRLVVASEPQQERLSAPSSPRTVDDGAGQISTAGALVEDLAVPGRKGVTAALHGVDGASGLTVDGQPGTIVRTDSVTDSAFIEVALAPFPTATVKGVLSGIAPRGNQNAAFVGATSGQTNTIISGWDAQVPNPSSRRQACVYTRRDAQAGDSGAALVTDDDWIAGFAFERSKINEVPAQCAWIWAESVLNRLQVKLT